MVEAGLLPSGSSRARNTNTEKPPPPLPLPIRISESGCAGHCLASFASGWGRHALKGSLPGSPLILPAPALRLGTYSSCPVCSCHRMSLSWLERKAEPAPLRSSLFSLLSSQIRGLVTWGSALDSCLGSRRGPLPGSGGSSMRCSPKGAQLKITLVSRVSSITLVCTSPSGYQHGGSMLGGSNL